MTPRSIFCNWHLLPVTWNDWVHACWLGSVKHCLYWVAWSPGGVLFSCSPWSDSYLTSLPLCSCSWCGGIWLCWTRRKFCGLGRVCFSSSLPHLCRQRVTLGSLIKAKCWCSNPLTTSYTLASQSEDQKKKKFNLSCFRDLSKYSPADARQP